MLSKSFRWTKSAARSHRPIKMDFRPRSSNHTLPHCVTRCFCSQSINPLGSRWLWFSSSPKRGFEWDSSSLARTSSNYFRIDIAITCNAKVWLALSHCGGRGFFEENTNSANPVLFKENRQSLFTLWTDKYKRRLEDKTRCKRRLMTNYIKNERKLVMPQTEDEKSADFANRFNSKSSGELFRFLAPFSSSPFFLLCISFHFICLSALRRRAFVVRIVECPIIAKTLQIKCCVR